MHTYGLIGKHLGHSYSGDWFQRLFFHKKIDAEYLLFEMEDIREVPGLLTKHPNLRGFNVTTPYKQDILSLCRDLDEEAKLTRATNCITVEGGMFIAHNTDVGGFIHLLVQVPDWRSMPGAMILGTGGAARAAARVFRQYDFPFLMVSRNSRKEGVIPYTSLKKEHIDRFPLIINATPLGMWPDVSSAPPLPYGLLTGSEMLVDLVYNPPETMFLRTGKQKGCFTINGLAMLYHQAERSWEIWQERL